MKLKCCLKNILIYILIARNQSDCRRLVLQGSVLTRIVNNAIVTGDVYVTEDGIIKIADEEEV